MKSVLLSVKPKWCELIANGEKTIEIRKTAPKEVPFKCYIYCTKEGRPFVKDWCENYCFTSGISKKEADKIFGNLQGKVIGEFVCDNVFIIDNGIGTFMIDDDQALTNEVANGSCLDYIDMRNYLGDKNGYAWHISDLKIYDRPKELSEFEYIKQSSKWKRIVTVTRPPQSWQYVGVKE